MPVNDTRYRIGTDVGAVCAGAGARPGAREENCVPHAVHNACSRASFALSGRSF
jgi:hypothetical protein